ncbi:MAG: hypothetical protein Q6K92_07515, partial [Thermostichus sp. DG_1_5_bins_95]
MAVTENRTQPIRSGIICVVLLGLVLLGLSACGIPSRPHLIGTVTSDPKTFNTYLAAESSSRDAITYL